MADRGLVDISRRLHESSIRKLLALSIGFPTPEKVKVVVQRYLFDPSRRIWGFETKGCVVGCIGIQQISPDEICIKHISVLPRARGKGIGRYMINWVCNELSPKKITAETDVGAAGFYIACGFSIALLAETYPGTKRFYCHLDVEN